MGSTSTCSSSGRRPVPSRGIALRALAMATLLAFAPATAEAVLALLDHHGIPLAGAHAVVVGRSTVVGKPAAHRVLAVARRVP